MQSALTLTALSWRSRVFNHIITCIVEKHPAAATESVTDLCKLMDLYAYENASILCNELVMFPKPQGQERVLVSYIICCCRVKLHMFITKLEQKRPQSGQFVALGFDMHAM